MNQICIAMVAVMAILFSVGHVAAQYGPEEIGAEESPLPDPDTETDDSNAELEQMEAMDGTEATTQGKASEGDRKGRGCAVGRSSSTRSVAPIAALLFAAAFVGLRRLRAAF